jgi:hypothetical protein
MPVQTLDKVREALNSLYAIHKSWRYVGTIVGLPAGTVHGIAVLGRVPKKEKTCKILGLPTLKPAPACPVCGIVHTRHCRKTYQGKDLFSYDPKELLKMLENREEIR